MTDLIDFTPGLRILHSLLYVAHTANQVHIKKSLQNMCLILCALRSSKKKYFKTNTYLNVLNAFKIMCCPSQAGIFHISLQFS